MTDWERIYEREIEALEEELRWGMLTQKEFNEAVKDLERGLREVSKLEEEESSNPNELEY